MPEGPDVARSPRHARLRELKTAAALAAGLSALTLAAPSAALARDFFVSPSGNDAAAGTSTSSPWRTVDKVNRTGLAPGDRVSFLGGASYSGTLMPSRSGSASAPITFKAYGSGKPTLTRGVWLQSVSHLRFEDLRVDGATRSFGSSGSGSGARNMVFLRTESRNADLGFHAASTADQGWTIQDCVVDRTRDSGIHSWAADTRVQNCRISNVGLNHGGYSHALHGIYVKGARLHATGNEIWANADAEGQAISTRYRDAVIENNYVHDLATGIGYFRDDSGQGTTTIRRNRFANTTKSVIYIGPGNRASGVGDNFHVYNNTVVNSRSIGHAAFRWASTGGKEFIFRNNAVQGYSSVLQTLSGVQQSNNVLGSLGLSAFTPLAGSPLVDRGTATIKAGSVTLAARCDGGATSYCGSAPDVGAVERR